MSELSNAIKNICEEKNLSYEAVIATIEQALAAAYRKDFGQKNQNIKVKFDPETAKSKVFDIKTVVEDMPEDEDEDSEEEKKEVQANKMEQVKSKKSEVRSQKLEEKKDNNKNKSSSADASEDEERKFNPKTEIQISDAKIIKKTAKIDGEIKTKLEVPEAYGRMAAQTAKQVIIQRLREAEREMVFNEFKDKEKEVVSGVVQRREGRAVLVDLGKSVGYLPQEEQIFGEKYNPGERVKVYIKEVRLGSKGAEIILSRVSDEILKKVFYLEIPEISNGLVELKAVAREAGSRSKVAVWTDSENVDPIGSCVGQRGARIQTIINELGGEKVDIILYNEESTKFISNALSPAKIIGIDISEKEKKATVKVLADQLSLAIGKSGQNARLAAKLTGWKIDIIEAKDKDTPKDVKEDAKEEKKKDGKKEKSDKSEKKNKSEKKIKKDEKDVEKDVGTEQSSAQAEKKEKKPEKKEVKKKVEKKLTKKIDKKKDEKSSSAPEEASADKEEKDDPSAGSGRDKKNEKKADKETKKEKKTNKK